MKHKTLEIPTDKTFAQIIECIVNPLTLNLILKKIAHKDFGEYRNDPDIFRLIYQACNIVDKSFKVEMRSLYDDNQKIKPKERNRE